MSWATLTQEHKTFIAKHLTELQLKVIQARLNGHTWNKIADSMNLDEATVRGHYKRATRRLNNARKDTA